MWTLPKSELGSAFKALQNFLEIMGVNTFDFLSPTLPKQSFRHQQDKLRFKTMPTENKINFQTTTSLNSSAANESFLPDQIIPKLFLKHLRSTDLVSNDNFHFVLWSISCGGFFLPYLPAPALRIERKELPHKTR